MTKTKRKHATPFMQALNFTAEDLMANRDGYLTSNQIADMQSGWLIRLMVETLFTSPFLGFLTLIAGETTSSALASRRSNLDIGISLSLLGFVALLFYGFGYRHYANWQKIQQDIRNGVNRSISGRALKITEPAHKYKLFIAYEKFEVSRAIYQQFQAGATYHLFFAPTTRQIVSAELVEPQPVEALPAEKLKRQS